MKAPAVLLVCIGLSTLSHLPLTLGSTLVVTNNCQEKVWVGTNGQAEDGKKWSDPGEGGFLLNSRQNRQLTVEVGWAGRVWGRTNCNAAGRCESGDCGQIKCKRSGQRPASLAELTLDRWRGLDFYSISLVDGGNLPIRIKPRNGNCPDGSCPHDMRTDCPNELRVIVGGRTVGCDSKNGVPAFRDYAKRVCPNAYGYWNDDTKTKSCQPPGPGKQTYDITFC